MEFLLDRWVGLILLGLIPLAGNGAIGIRARFAYRFSLGFRQTKWQRRKI